MSPECTPEIGNIFIVLGVLLIIPRWPVKMVDEGR
jgi:hypothetical protein